MRSAPYSGTMKLKSISSWSWPPRAGRGVSRSMRMRVSSIR